MNIIKIVFWVIIIGFVSLIILQNPDFSASKQKLSLNLWFWEYPMQEIPNWTVSAAFFVIGFLSAYLTSAVERFMSKRAIRTLNRTLDAQNEEIGVLKNKLSGGAKGVAGPANPSPVQELKQKSQAAG